MESPDRLSWTWVHESPVHRPRRITPSRLQMEGRKATGESGFCVPTRMESRPSVLSWQTCESTGGREGVCDSSCRKVGSEHSMTGWQPQDVSFDGCSKDVIHRRKGQFPEGSRAEAGDVPPYQSSSQDAPLYQSTSHDRIVSKQSLTAWCPGMCPGWSVVTTSPSRYGGKRPSSACPSPSSPLRLEEAPQRSASPRLPSRAQSASPSRTAPKGMRFAAEGVAESVAAREGPGAVYSGSSSREFEERPPSHLVEAGRLAQLQDRQRRLKQLWAQEQEKSLAGV